MHSNQPNNANKQPDNGGNQLKKSSSRAFSTGRAGAQTVSHGSDDVAANPPASPRDRHLAADRKMDDDSGLSNTTNRNASELDRNEQQERQSNVGRRSDGTPD